MIKLKSQRDGPPVEPMPNHGRGSRPNHLVTAEEVFSKTFPEFAGRFAESAVFGPADLVIKLPNTDHAPLAELIDNPMIHGGAYLVDQIKARRNELAERVHCGHNMHGVDQTCEFYGEKAVEILSSSHDTYPNLNGYIRAVPELVHAVATGNHLRILRVVKELRDIDPAGWTKSETETT